MWVAYDDSPRHFDPKKRPCRFNPNLTLAAESQVQWTQAFPVVSPHAVDSLGKVESCLAIGDALSG
jgi:hypothetical protein